MAAYTFLFAHFAKWFGPRGFTTTIREADMRVGGLLRFDMRAPDGKVWDNRIAFLEIKRPAGKESRRTASPADRPVLVGERARRARVVEKSHADCGTRSLLHGARAGEVVEVRRDKAGADRVHLDPRLG